MRKTEIIMGMPITIEIVGRTNNDIFSDLFSYFREIDKRYSTYKRNSEISLINSGLPKKKISKEMNTVLELCEQTKKQTNGYFNILHNNKLDPSGLVKGWSIHNATKKLLRRGFKNFYIEAGGDIQVNGTNSQKQAWVIGIRNPFNVDEIVKNITIRSGGIATSGTYIRGQHIYNPLEQNDQLINKVKSLTVIGPNIYEADRFATAAFAMGENGIVFIESLDGFEGYMINDNGVATYTSGFESYIV